MTKYLLLMRHAKSDWNDAGLSDKERPLNARGRATAPVMASWLARQNRMPALVLCSSAVRTRQTLDIMTQRWTTLQESNPGVDLPKVHIDDSLYLASEFQILSSTKKSVSSLRAEVDHCVNCVMVLAHNPGLEILVSQLSNHQNEMPTGAIAVFESNDDDGEWPNNWGDGKMWKLRELAKPRELDLETI